MQEGVYPFPLSMGMGVGMPDPWKFRPRFYPHFDHVVSTRQEAETIIKKFQKSGTHSFLPFLEEPCSNRRFSVYLKQQKALENGQEVPDDSVNKNRPIKYAAHVDAQIFSYFRHIISQKYEELLARESLEDFPIAYRKIPVQKDASKGKCNIHYAKEAFDEIVRRGECVALTYDIKGFFESLDHAFLEEKWLEVMEFDKLPDDHAAVFKAMTEYRFVDKDACYETLGLFEWKGTKRKLLKCPHRLFREQKMLCDKKDYRNKIVGAGLVKANSYQGSTIPQGIPQGSPMSDILANIYMIDFDRRMSNLAAELGGYYRRYSDDILWICAVEHAERVGFEIAAEIARQGSSTLSLHLDKTTRTQFFRTEGGLTSSGHLFSYLGFSFDGRIARYRERTISNYQRNATQSVYSFVRRAYEKHKASGISFERALNVSQIFHKVGFANRAYNAKRRADGDKPEANFMTYHLRAAAIFNSDDGAQYKLSAEQLRHYKLFIKKKIQSSAEALLPTFSLT